MSSKVLKFLFTYFIISFYYNIAQTFYKITFFAFNIMRKDSFGLSIMTNGPDCMCQGYLDDLDRWQLGMKINRP